MTVTKFAGRDLVLSIGATVVGQVTALGNAGSARALIDASAYGDAWKDYVMGQQDGNEVDVEVALNPGDAGQIALEAAYAAGTPSTFQMEHVAAAFEVSFPALVISCERGGAKDGLLIMITKLKIVSPGVTDLS